MCSLGVLIFQGHSTRCGESLGSSDSFLFSSSGSSLFHSSSLHHFSLSSTSVHSIFLLSTSVSECTAVLVVLSSVLMWTMS